MLDRCTSSNGETCGSHSMSWVSNSPGCQERVGNDNHASLHEGWEFLACADGTLYGGKSGALGGFRFASVRDSFRCSDGYTSFYFLRLQASSRASAHRFSKDGAPL